MKNESQKSFGILPTSLTNKLDCVELFFSMCYIYAHMHNGFNKQYNLNSSAVMGHTPHYLFYHHRLWFGLENCLLMIPLRLPSVCL